MYEKITLAQSFKDYESEQFSREREAQSIYSAIGCYFHWKVDAVYEDKIIDLVGKYGLALVMEFHLMEPCGSINGRKLYAL